MLARLVGAIGAWGRACLKVGDAIPSLVRTAKLSMTLSKSRRVREQKTVS